MPDRLWTATHDEVVAYLRSIFQADGYVTVRRDNGCENGRVAFAVIGERWAEDVQLLLGSIGIYSRRLRKHETRPDRHDLHEVADLDRLRARAVRRARSASSTRASSTSCSSR